MGGHRTRVGALAWSSSTLSSRAATGTSCSATCAPSRSPASSSGTRARCAVGWSYDDRELASGGNDNQLFVWSANSQHPVLRYGDHTAAVKAIAWSPHQHGLLASGGGTADRCIRFWNTTTDTALSCVDTGSQVCNLVWSKTSRARQHAGYSQNQIVVWQYPDVQAGDAHRSHAARAVPRHLARRADRGHGRGDETLRFWNVFPGPKSDPKLPKTPPGDTGARTSGERLCERDSRRRMRRTTTTTTTIRRTGILSTYRPFFSKRYSFRNSDASRGGAAAARSSRITCRRWQRSARPPEVARRRRGWRRDPRTRPRH